MRKDDVDRLTNVVICVTLEDEHSLSVVSVMFPFMTIKSG